MAKKFEIERFADSMATISDIIFRRLKTMECNQCEPCGPAFMQALTNIRAMGNVIKVKGDVTKGAKGRGGTDQ